ncbi:MULTISPECIES: hypothetical protein [unclassified Psychrobacter]|uniref:hypothetical protein n=1 Tax=unclassified Psychrobacter TaxID=196806 RepID=UPI003F460CC5
MSLTQYEVGDLIINAEKLKVLMVLESPYVNEIIHNHPAAGESALDLTRLLTRQGYVPSFNPDVPVGCNIQALNYAPLGILNCSHLPMNADAYPCGLPNNAQSQVDNLATLKQRLAPHHQPDVSIILANTAVFTDFSRRLTSVLRQNPNVAIVPCGQTASGFIDSFVATTDQSPNIIARLPHPTEDAWQNVANTDLHAIIGPAMLP